MPGLGVGALRERLTVQTATVQAVTVSTLTSSGTTATAATLTAHGLTTGDFATIAGADQAYNGKVKVTVTGTLTFTFTCTAGLTTPATGAMTVTYVSDAQGGRVETWRTLDTIAAELIPISGTERLQRAAIQSDTVYRFRVRRRADVTAKQRALWTPSWPPNASQTTLEIAGVVPADDGRTWMHLECAVSPR